MTQTLTTQELIDKFNLTLADSRRDFSMIENVILGQGFIVMCGDFALTFTIEDRRAVAVSGRTRAGLAPRFSKEDAERIATTVTNGAGVGGRAIHVRHAIQEEISRIEGVIASIEAIPAEA